MNKVASSKMPKVLMATGASGGHIFPALAIAEALRLRGYESIFAVGGKRFDEQIRSAQFAVHHLPAAPWSNRGPLGKITALVTVFKSFLATLELIKQYKPNAVIGTGGYASVAAILAARWAGVPTAIHEQNAIPGRANRLLGKFSTRIMLGFENARTHFAENAKKCVVTGNPMRQDIIAAANTTIPNMPPFRILLLGGSKGAVFLSELLPQALRELSEGQLTQLAIVHQAPDNIPQIEEKYRALGVYEYKVAPFFNDMPAELSAAHLVIGRAGASTINEVALFGRPSILVPLPHWLADNHQFYNAKTLADAGGALLLEQVNATPQALGQMIVDLMQNEQKRVDLASKAIPQAHTKAAAYAADAIVKLIEQNA